MSVAILDYEAGNLASVARAVRHLGREPVVTRDPDAVRRAERVIFPGVGAARAAMESLTRLGLDGALRDAHAAGTPILGICIGCQILFDESEEDGGTKCLGLLPGRVVRFPSGSGWKIPHMGWNRVDFRRPHPVLEGLPSDPYFYFVHSYYCRPQRSEDVLGTADYAGVTFAAAVARDNLVAVQFHAEKSGPLGLSLLEKFLRWDGRDPGGEL